MASKAFGTQKRPAGKEFRDGTVGEALDEVYKDVDAGFQALEQATEAPLANDANAATIVTTVNSLITKLKAAGIIADS